MVGRSHLAELRHSYQKIVPSDIFKRKPLIDSWKRRRRKYRAGHLNTSRLHSASPDTYKIIGLRPQTRNLDHSVDTDRIHPLADQTPSVHRKERRDISGDPEIHRSMSVVRDSPQHREHHRFLTTESMISCDAPTQYARYFLSAHLDMVLMRQSLRSTPKNAATALLYLPTRLRKFHIRLNIIEFVIISRLISRKRRIDDNRIHALFRTAHHVILYEIHLLSDSLRHITGDSMIYPRKTIESAGSARRFQCFLNLARAAKSQRSCTDNIIRNKLILRAMEHHHRARLDSIIQRAIHHNRPSKSHNSLIVKVFRKAISHMTIVAKPARRRPASPIRTTGRSPIAKHPLRLLHRNRPRRRTRNHKIVRVNAHRLPVLHKVLRSRKQILHSHSYRIVQKTGELRLRNSTYTLETQAIIDSNHPVASGIHFTEPGTKPSFRT